MMNGGDSRIIDVLLLLAPTVSWLSEAEPVNFFDIPEAHLGAMKRLEVLGLVYRRNARSCALQKQRLIKMLKRESRYVTAEKQEQCLSAFAMILDGDNHSHKNRSPETVCLAAAIA